MDVCQEKENEKQEAVQESSSGGVMSQEEIEAMLAGSQEEQEPEVQPEPEKEEASEQTYQNIGQPYSGMPSDARRWIWRRSRDVHDADADDAADDAADAVHAAAAR